MARRTALLTVVVALLAPASASAAGWLTPQSFAAPGPSAAQGYVDNQGNMTAVWQDQSAAAGTCTIRFADRANSVFGSVQTIGASPASSAGDCGLQLAADAAGDAVAVWTNGANVVAATRSAGGPWTTHSLEATDGANYSKPSVAMNASGDAVAVWLHNAGGSPALRTASFNPVDGWGSATDVDTAGATVAFGDPSVGLDAQGNARALWEQLDSTAAPASASVRTAIAAPGGALASPATIGPSSTSHTYSATEVKPDGQHHWLAVWRDTGPAGKSLASAFADNTGAFTADTGQFSGAEQPAIDPPAIAFRSDGTAILVWSYRGPAPGNLYSVLALTRAPASGITWSFPASNLIGGTPTADVQFASTGAVAVDSGDRLQIVYTVGNTVYGTQGADLSHLQGVPSQLGSGSVPVMARGATYGAAVWNAGSVIDLSVFDPVPPTAPVISSPASAEEITPVAFSATATDEFGPVTIDWQFGDGTSGHGNSVSHTYGAAGNYPVTAKAVDGGGNSTSNTITFPVTASPGGGGGGGGGGGQLPPPTAGVNANVSVLSGDVLVKTPGSGAFVPLTSATQLVLGTVIDARDGRLQITVADGTGKLLSGIASGGEFVLQQNVGAQSSRAAQPKFNRTLAAKLVLYGGSFKGCPKPRRSGKAAIAKQRKKKSNSPVRQVWTNGNLQTQAKYAATVVRGTVWLTQDRCDGTLVKVRSGIVIVHDSVKNRNFVVKAGHQYLAKAR